MARVISSKMTCAVLLFFLAMSIPSPAQTFNTLVNFAGANGANPYSGLIQGSDGNFYGTTSIGGSSSSCFGGCGTVFKITPGGTLTTLYSFSGTDGSFPAARLVQANDGNFYGTTSTGGSSTSCFGGCGTVFMITPAGVLTTLHSLVSTEGNGPNSALLQAADGDLYGVTSYGGANACIGTPGCGAVFKITLEGTLKILHSFDGTDGSNPLGGLIQTASGKFYGTTQFGGANNACGTDSGCGTIYSMTSGGAVTTLYSFCVQTGCTDGAVPNSRLVLGPAGRFYGTTYSGGTNNDGTIFALSPAGGLRTLHRFIGSDGFDPGELIRGTDGNFYGTTEFGGNFSCPNDCGTIFKITSQGVLTPVHHFDGNDGSNPIGGLVEAGKGTFYGTAAYGGANGDGTIFTLSLPRASIPSVKPPAASADSFQP